MDYRGPIEAALSTDLRGEPHNFSLWDIHTGTQIVVFKGSKGNPIPKCLQLIDNNYFVTAHDNVLHIWSIFNRKCQDQKLFLPGRPSVLCVSPCGNYLVVGMSEMLYVWQWHSGNLLAHTQRHYQTISTLKMNQQGTFLFSGGEDGTVLVWPFADLISNTHHTGSLNLSASRQDIGVNEPRFTWQHHSAQVTDIHVTNGGRCITTGADAAVNIYSYVDGKRLFSVTMPSPVWSVAMNKNETDIYLGGQDGNIYGLSVSSMGVLAVDALDNGPDGSRKPIFSGHKGKVISMILSTDGTRLISSSVDSSCKIWDVFQRRLLQDIKHQAPLANLASLLVPDALALTSMTQSQIKPPLSVKPLKRNLYKPPRDSTVMSEDLFEEGSTTIINIKNKVDRWDLQKVADEEPVEEKKAQISSSPLGRRAGALTNGVSDSDKIVILKQKLRDLYLMSAEKIFKDAAEDCLKPAKPLVEEIVTMMPARKRKSKKVVKTIEAKKIKKTEA